MCGLVGNSTRCSEFSRSGISCTVCRLGSRLVIVCTISPKSVNPAITPRYTYHYLAARYKHYLVRRVQQLLRELRRKRVHPLPDKLTESAQLKRLANSHPKLIR